MQTLAETALVQQARLCFTRYEVAHWLDGTPDRQSAIIKRAIASGEVLHLRRGLYCLAPRLQQHRPDPLVLAQRIYGPSYISFETALSFHGWIPEAVNTITSTSLMRSREFATPLGQFSFIRVPQRVLYVEVLRIENQQRQAILIASPLKALADYVYAYKKNWCSIEPIIESLRVDERELQSIGADSINELLENSSAPRVRRFLRGLRKDLNK